MNIDVKISLPKIVEDLLAKLNVNSTRDAFVVGGCVRDSLRGLTPNDWDICTVHSPEMVKSLLSEYEIYDKGIKFGTVAVIYNCEEFEITTFREDCDYSDCRHPGSVVFKSDIKSDLARRDFTVNAMSYNHDEGLIDLFNGYEDLNKGILNSVGDPNERFQEDALRMLRAVRLSAQHSFEISDNVCTAIKENAHLVRNVSLERINVELRKTLLSCNPDYIEKFVYLGLGDLIFPEISILFSENQNNPNHWRDGSPTTVGFHTMETLRAAVNLGKNDSRYNSLKIRLALLFHDTGKPLCRGIKKHNILGDIDTFYKHGEKSVEITAETLKRLKFSKKLIADVTKLVEFHDTPLTKMKNTEEVINESCMRKILFKLGAANSSNKKAAMILLEDLLFIKIADAMGQNPSEVDGISKSSFNKIDDINHIKSYFKQNPHKFEIVLPVTGGDVKKALNFTNEDMKLHGKFVGSILNKLQEQVIKDISILEKLSSDCAYKHIWDLAKSMDMDSILNKENTL